MKNNFLIISFLICIFIIFSGFKCNSKRVSENKVYTLYRSSVMVENMRIHVATFDADEEEKYNCENCETAASLYQNQPGVVAKFWCEKGYYKK